MPTQGGRAKNGIPFPFFYFFLVIRDMEWRIAIGIVIGNGYS